MEIELLLRAAGRDAPPDALTTLCARADWRALLEAAEFHGLTPLLARMASGAAPEEAARRLRAAALDGVRRALFFQAGLRTLLAAFEPAIPLISLKGPALANRLYDDPALRPCSDLDILVAPAHVAQALRILARENFHLTPRLAALPVETLLRFSCEARLRGAHIDVDLQWATAPRGHALGFPAGLLWRARKAAPPGEDGVPRPTLEATLVYLCAHGAKHGWSRLIWLADIDRLARSDVDWAGAAALAGEAHCERPLLLGIALAHDLLGAPVPDALLTRAAADAAVRACLGRAPARLCELPPVEPDSLALTRFSGALANGRMEELRHYASLTLSPTEAEFVVASFPDSLSFLYYPLRFARLAGKTVGRLFVRA